MAGGIPPPVDIGERMSGAPQPVWEGTDWSGSGSGREVGWGIVATGCCGGGMAGGSGTATMEGMGGTATGSGAGARGEVTVAPQFGQGPVMPARWTGTVRDE